MEEPTVIGYRRLACAVLIRAYRDAAEGNGHSAAARAWLASSGAVDLVNLLELDPAGLARAVDALPEPRAVQLPLLAMW